VYKATNISILRKNFRNIFKTGEVYEGSYLYNELIHKYKLIPLFTGLTVTAVLIIIVSYDIKNYKQTEDKLLEAQKIGKIGSYETNLLTGI